MKSYKTILLELKTKQPKGDVVLKKKINGIPVLIVKVCPLWCILMVIN